MASNHSNDGRLKLIDEGDLPSGLDPHLQQVLLQLKFEPEEVPSPIDVIGIVKPHESIPEAVIVSARVDDTFSGRIAPQAIQNVRNDPAIISLKAARPLFPLLDNSVADVRCDASTLLTVLPLGSSSPTGAGVVVGVVDIGLDVKHGNFRDGSNNSRVRWLWDQRTDPPVNAPAPYNYGREFSASDIDSYISDGTIDSKYPIDARGHGTVVTDIAAGDGSQSGETGIAPLADIIFVEIDAKAAGTKALYDAVDYIFQKASAQPAVVNISLGANLGPHDGTTPLDQAFAQYLQTSGRAIVLAAGNSAMDRIHASGAAVRDAPAVLEWFVREDTQNASEMDIWYSGPGTLAVSLVSPPPDSITFHSIVSNRGAALVLDGSLVGSVIHRSQDPNNGAHEIYIRLEATAGTGQWSVVLTTDDGTAVPFDAWIEIAASQSSFARGYDPTGTLNAIACGDAVVTVGAYDMRTQPRQASDFTGTGPTRDGRNVVVLAAPGEGVTAARPGSNHAIDATGTSVAAPHVTGALALLLRAASHPLRNSEIHDLLSETAASLPGELASRIGSGALDGTAAMARLLARNSASVTHSRLGKARKH